MESLSAPPFIETAAPVFVIKSSPPSAFIVTFASLLVIVSAPEVPVIKVLSVVSSVSSCTLPDTTLTVSEYPFKLIVPLTVPLLLIVRIDSDCV